MKQIWLTNYLQNENYVSEYTKREGVETLHERQCRHQKHTKTHKSAQIYVEKWTDKGIANPATREDHKLCGGVTNTGPATPIKYEMIIIVVIMILIMGWNIISRTSNSFSSRLQLHTWFVPNFDQYLACKSPFWLHNLSSIIFQVCFLCFVLIMFPVVLCFLF